MREIVGNDRAGALARLDEKAELAFEAWQSGMMPDDLYKLRVSQIAEQRARLERDLAHFTEAAGQ